jgi:hypothetical protein
MWLQRQVNEAIKRFIHVELPHIMLSELKGKGMKQKFLGLLDESVYDEDKREILNTILKEAIQKG